MRPAILAMMSVLCIPRGRVTGLWKASAIATLCLAIQIPRADATTYYVSSSGSDGNAGTSTNAPWQHLSKVSGFGSPGDSILLKAGDSFDGPVTVHNGAPNSPITFGRYAVGANPIIYGDHPNATWSAVAGHPRVYSTTIPGSVEHVYDINGVKYNLILRGTNTLDAWLASFVPTNWGGIDQPTIYVMTPDSNSPPRMHLFEWATVLMGAYDVVENIDVRSGGMAVLVGSHCIVRNIAVQDMISDGIFVGSSVSSEIASNTVTRTGEDSIYMAFGGNHWVHDNTLSYVGGDYTGCTILGCPLPRAEQCGIGLQQGTNNLIEHNSISYTFGSFVDWYYEVCTTCRYNYGFHCYGGACFPMGSGIKLNNNIFIPVVSGGIAAYHITDAHSPAADAGGLLIYNNVIYNFVGDGLFTTSVGGQSTGVKFRNNIVVALAVTNSVNWFEFVGSVADSDYNVYYTAGPARNWVWNGKSYSTLAALQASGPEPRGLYVNPQFVSASPSVAADFQLKSTSPCVNAGQDLKGASLLAPSQSYLDYLSTSIPQGAGADIGAYEYKLAPLAPASNLEVIPH
jgi:hypothetical protein